MSGVGGVHHRQFSGEQKGTRQRAGCSVFSFMPSSQELKRMAASAPLPKLPIPFLPQAKSMDMWHMIIWGKAGEHGTDSVPAAASGEAEAKSHDDVAAMQGLLPTSTLLVHMHQVRSAIVLRREPL